MTTRRAAGDPSVKTFQSPAGARLATLLRSADADVIRALRLARVESEADLLATSDLKFMQLPLVGRATLQKLRALRQSLRLPEPVRHRPAFSSRSITLHLDSDEDRRLHAVAAGIGVQPKEWLRLALLEVLREGTAPAAKRMVAGADDADRGVVAAQSAPVPLGDADPDVVRALALAGVRTVAQLDRLADWQLLALPKVGNSTVRKVNALARRLGLATDKSKGRGQRGACYSLRVEIDMDRLEKFAAVAKMPPWTWLRRTLLEALAPHPDDAGRDQASAGGSSAPGEPT